MTNKTVSSKGWVVIPADLRKKYDLRPGKRVKIIDYGGVLAILPLMEDPIEEAAGILEAESSLTTALVDEHGQEAARER